MKALLFIFGGVIGALCVSLAEQQTKVPLTRRDFPAAFGRIEFREFQDFFSVDVTGVKKIASAKFDVTGLMVWLLKKDGTVVPCVKFPEKRGGIGNLGFVNYSNEFQFRPKVPVSELVSVEN